MSSSRYVPHPRYGNKPLVTGLDTDESDPEVHLHFLEGCYSTERLARIKKNSPIDISFLKPNDRIVPGTAIVADISKQAPYTVPVTHYYDLERNCRDCGVLFLFFAQEQKYWYEELGFPLESDCVRCPSCRRSLREVRKAQQRYQELVTAEERSADQELELADLRLSLVEQGLMTARSLEAVRHFLNRNPDHPRAAELQVRADAIR